MESLTYLRNLLLSTCEKVVGNDAKIFGIIDRAHFILLCKCSEITKDGQNVLSSRELNADWHDKTIGGID